MVQAPDDILLVPVALTVYFLVKIDFPNFSKDTYPPLNDVVLGVCLMCTSREYISSVGAFEFKMLWHIGVREREARVPPWASKFFRFHAVFRKIWQNRMLAPPGELVPPPQGNPRSPTVTYSEVDPAFHTGRGANLQGDAKIGFCQFSPKLHEIKKILVCSRGVGVPPWICHWYWYYNASNSGKWCRSFHQHYICI